MVSGTTRCTLTAILLASCWWLWCFECEMRAPLRNSQCFIPNRQRYRSLHNFSGATRFLTVSAIFTSDIGAVRLTLSAVHSASQHSVCVDFGGEPCIQQRGRCPISSSFVLECVVDMCITFCVFINEFGCVFGRSGQRCKGPSHFTRFARPASHHRQHT